MMITRGREAGLTLVELMFAASIMAILMLGAGSIIATISQEGDEIDIQADARDWLKARGVRLEAELKPTTIQTFYDQYKGNGRTEDVLRADGGIKYSVVIKLHTDESGGVLPEHGGLAKVSNTAADGDGADDLDLNGDGRIESGSGNVPSGDLVIFPMSITLTLTDPDRTFTSHLVLLKP